MPSGRTVAQVHASATAHLATLFWQYEPHQFGAPLHFDAHAQLAVGTTDWQTFRTSPVVREFVEMVKQTL